MVTWSYRLQSVSVTIHSILCRTGVQCGLSLGCDPVDLASALASTCTFFQCSIREVPLCFISPPPVADCAPAPVRVHHDDGAAPAVSAECIPSLMALCPHGPHHSPLQKSPPSGSVAAMWVLRRCSYRPPCTYGFPDRWSSVSTSYRPPASSTATRGRFHSAPPARAGASPAVLCAFSRQDVPPYRYLLPVCLCVALHQPPPPPSCVVHGLPVSTLPGIFPLLRSHPI